MSTEPDDGPDERLLRELARLPRELVPPKGLEARVVAALRERGWLAAARPRPNPWRLGGALAARPARPLPGFLAGRPGGPPRHSPPPPPVLPLPPASADLTPR